MKILSKLSLCPCSHLPLNFHLITRSVPSSLFHLLSISTQVPWLLFDRNTSSRVYVLSTNVHHWCTALSYWQWAFPCSQRGKLPARGQVGVRSILLGPWLAPLFSFFLAFFLKIEANLTTALAVPFFLPGSLICIVKPSLDFSIFCKYNKFFQFNNSSVTPSPWHGASFFVNHTGYTINNAPSSLISWMIYPKQHLLRLMGVLVSRAQSNCDHLH